MTSKKVKNNKPKSDVPTIAIYPGTFDPITNGHADVVNSAMKICDHLIIAIANDTPKKTLFNLKERVELVKHDIKTSCPQHADKISVEGFKGLLVEYASKKNAQIIVRGLRAVSDFEYEFQLASMNKRIDDTISTIFLPASEDTHFIASSLVKEVARLKGDVTKFVSENTSKKLKSKF